jgi:hypothetical protein
MTKETKTPENKVTKAGTVELEEKDLDDVAGGVTYDRFLKIDGIEGESYKIDASRSDFKLNVGDELTQKVSPTIKTTSLKR